MVQKSGSVVIGSPADQYMCTKKERTEAALSAGLLAKPERHELSYAELSWGGYSLFTKSREFKLNSVCHLKGYAQLVPISSDTWDQGTSESRSAIFPKDRIFAAREALLSNPQKMHPRHFATRMSWGRTIIEHILIKHILIEFHHWTTHQTLVLRWTNLSLKSFQGSPVESSREQNPALSWWASRMPKQLWGLLSVAGHIDSDKSGDPIGFWFVFLNVHWQQKLTWKCFCSMLPHAWIATCDLSNRPNPFHDG